MFRSNYMVSKFHLTDDEIQNKTIKKENRRVDILKIT